MSDQVDSTWKETSFRNAQKYSTDHKAGKVLNKTSEGHDGAPADNEHTDVVRGTLELLE